MGAMGSCLFNNVSFLSYFLTLKPYVKGFAELIAWTFMLVFILSKLDLNYT